MIDQIVQSIVSWLISMMVREESTISYNEPRLENQLDSESHSGSGDGRHNVYGDRWSRQLVFWDFAQAKCWSFAAGT